MKKVIIALAAVVSLAACSKEETLIADRGDAIGFGTPFVDNATRADYSDGTTLIDQFLVYGTVTGNGNTVNIFEGATVSRNGKQYGEIWECNQEEYWVPQCTYEFAAVVDAVSVKTDDTTGMPLELTYAVGGGDLLYATASESTVNANGTPANSTVAFSFGHLLSKVLFSFENGAENTNYGFEVTDVTVGGFNVNGKYTIASEAWAATDTTTTDLSFGNGSEAQLILPLEQTLDITITYDVIYKGEKINVGVTKSKADWTYAFETNTVYDINVKIPAPGAEMTFTVKEVGQWDEPSADITIP
ncbi:MAG: fimbrillin family protein [Alistipes sp.]|nr:fimbrillin family protein [Alistipes sp.]